MTALSFYLNTTHVLWREFFKGGLTALLLSSSRRQTSPPHTLFSTNILQAKVESIVSVGNRMRRQGC